MDFTVLIGYVIKSRVDPCNPCLFCARFFVYGLCYLIKFPYLANLYQLALRNTSLTNTNLYYD